jgi:hypothetical protein
MTEPNAPLHPDKNLGWSIWALWLVTLILALAGLIAACAIPKDHDHAGWHILIVASLALGPPTWFLLEAAFRSQPGGKGPLTPMEQFFYDAAGKFWAGVLALLLAIYAMDQWNKTQEAAKGQQQPAAGAGGKPNAGGP